jgi:hypothetical protein
MLIFLFTFLAALSARAQLEFPTLGAGPGEGKVLIRTSGSIYDSAAVGEGTSTRMQQSLLLASVPVAKTDTDTWSATASVATLHTDNAFLLPSATRVPNTLQNINFGANYNHKLEGKKFWGVNLSYGSASDRPFSESSVSTVGANFSYLLSAEETSSWVLIVNYSNNRPILNNVPLPGFAYSYTPSKEFRGIFGFPFVFTRWEFQPAWSWTFIILGFSVVKTEVAYSVWGPLQIFSYYDFSQQPFLLRDRTDRKQRLFYNEQRLVFGVRAPLGRSVLAELTAGQAFGRSFFRAESYEHRNEDLRSLDSANLLQLTLNARF